MILACWYFGQARRKQWKAFKQKKEELEQSMTWIVMNNLELLFHFHVV